MAQGKRADRLYAAALLGQVLAFFGGFLGAVHALAHGSAIRAGVVAAVALAIIVACSRVRGALRRQVRAIIVKRVTDPVLGLLTYDEDEDWWTATVTIEGRAMGFKIGGDTSPAPALLSHAHEIIQSAGPFRAKMRAFLDGEAGRSADFADEIRALDSDDVCLFWPDRPNDGMIYFRGPEGADTRRLWRCDYVEGEPKLLGFDG